jgi:hypothetical protein
MPTFAKITRLETSSIAWILSLCMVFPLQASGPGTTGGNVLQIPVGARAIAMGEAYTAQADDVSSLYWNPAGLALLNQSQASFMYDKSYDDMAYSHAAVATPLENGGLGASLSYLTYGQISGYSESDGPIGDVNAYSGVATLGAAYLGDNWSAGVNAKGVQGRLAEVKATGFASDAGLTLIYPREVMAGTLRLGAVVRNLGTGLKYIEQKDPFPTEWRVGFAGVQMLHRRLSFSADYGKANDNDGSIYAGAEYWILPFLALRGGYAADHSESNGLRAGLGLKVNDLSFDYAYSQYGDLGMSNRFEIVYRFGVMRPLLSPEERKILRKGKQALREGRFSDSVLLFNALMELEPRYAPVRQLIKRGMGGLEQQERLAKNVSPDLPSMLRYSKPSQDPGDVNDLTQLLMLGSEELKAASAMTTQVK